SPDLADLPRAVRRASDTVSLGIVVAALIVAAAVVIVAKDDQAAAIGRIAIVTLSGVGLAAFVSRLFRRD
ncbi:MAG: hypothetical protein JHD15_14455, partial [Phenylobacterium sp.]|nr:hypothetical protein [Phenylobacterium sp.]